MIAPRDHAGQAIRAVENLLAALAEHNVGADALLNTTIFVVAEKRADLVRVWDAVTARLDRTPSTLPGVSLLGYPDQLVEIEGSAVASFIT